MGVDRAIEISATDRIVNVGFGGGDEEDEDVWGVMEERSRGHSAIAFDSVLSRIGKYVSLVYCPEPGIGVFGGGLGRIAVGEKGRRAWDSDEFGRYLCGMCAFSNGSSPCNSVKSRVVEYLYNSH